MRIYCIFGQRHDDENQDVGSPELVEAIDESVYIDSPEILKDALEGTLRDPEYARARIILVEVDDNAVAKLLGDIPQIAGKVSKTD